MRCLAIVPAFNERGSVGPLVSELQRCTPQLDIVVIDDGSTDATSQHVPPGAVVLRLPFNLGIGSAMQTGYRYAALHGYDLAVQVDGDGQHPPSEINLLIDTLVAQKADMVVGSRFLGGERYDQGFARRLGSGVLRLLIRALTGRTYTDCTSGFRVANASVIRAFAHWYPEDYPEPEVIPLLHRAGFRVIETPVRMDPRVSGRTSITLLGGLFYVIKVAGCLVLDMIREPWPPEELAAS